MRLEEKPRAASGGWGCLLGSRLGAGLLARPLHPGLASEHQEAWTLDARLGLAGGWVEALCPAVSAEPPWQGAGVW